MNSDKKKFDVKIKTEYTNREPFPEFYRGFSIKFENISIRINNNSIDEVIDAILTTLNKDKSVHINGLSINHLCTKDIEKLQNGDLYIRRCYVCKKESPIFEIYGINDYTRLYLCKRHLRKLYDHLNSIKDACYITIESFEDFKIKTKN